MMFSSALGYVYRSCSRHDFVGRVAQCLAPLPSRCHVPLRFTCAVSQLRSPRKTWGWSLGRHVGGINQSYSTMAITKHVYNRIIRESQMNFESKAEWNITQDGRSKAEIISDYENRASKADSDLDGEILYIFAVGSLLKDSPKSQETHLPQDDRISSALQIILNKGLMEGSSSSQLRRLLLVGARIHQSPEVLRFSKELERHMSQVWSEWPVKSKIQACHGWFRLSAIHRQKYFEDQIRIFLKHMREAKLGWEEPGRKNIYQLLHVLSSVTYYSNALGGRWADENDVGLFLQNLETWYFDMDLEPKEVDSYVSVCHSVDYLVPSDILWKMLKILQKATLCEEVGKDNNAYLCIKNMLDLAQKQELNKDFMYIQYVTELAEVFKKQASLLSLMHQIEITWKFSLVLYCDHEMILKVLKNYVADEQDGNNNNVYKLVTAYRIMDCNPNITLVETVRDLIQSQGKNASPFQLLSIAHDLICRHGYLEVFSEILDCFFESDLMKEEFLSELSPGRIKIILELCGRLEIEQIDRYVKKIPPSLYKVHGVQDCAEKLKTDCQLSSVKAVLAAVQINLGGSHMARIMPVLPIYLPIVECCLNEVNEPVDMELVPRVFDENGFLKVENLSALPEGWRKIAVLVLPSQYKHLFINKPAYTGDFKAKLHFLGRAGYQKVVLVTKVPIKEKLHKCMRDILKEIPDIRLPDN